MALIAAPEHATAHRHDGETEQGEQEGAGQADDAFDARHEPADAAVPGLHQS